jgi:hypothetical protein
MHPTRESGQPSPDGSLEAHEREDSIGLLSLVLSSHKFLAKSLGHLRVLGSRNGGTTFNSLHGPDPGPAVHSVPNLVYGIEAQVQVQAAVGAQYLALPKR